MTAIDEKRDAIIRMQSKILALISAASLKGELAQALSDSDSQNPCHQIVGKLLTERIRRAQKAARRAVSEASRKYWRNDRSEKYDTHKLTWDLLSRIGLLLEHAELPSDYTIADWARETTLTRIYNTAWFAHAFVDVALKACTLAETAASSTATANRDGAKIKALRPTEVLVH